MIKRAIQYKRHYGWLSFIRHLLEPHIWARKYFQQIDNGDTEAKLSRIEDGLNRLTSRINTLNDLITLIRTDSSSNTPHTDKDSNYQLTRLTDQLYSEGSEFKQEAAAVTLNMRETLEFTKQRIITSQSAYLGDNVAIARTRFGHKIYVDTLDTGICPHILLDGVWELWVTTFLQKILSPGMVFVDVGAHVGWFTLVACESVQSHGKVIAVEPQPKLAALIRSSLYVNGYRDRASVLEAALSDTSGRATLFQKPNDSGSATMLGGGEEFMSQIEVNVLCLDDILAKQRVDCVKIDAEGLEPRILTGARKIIEANPQIQFLIEHHPGNEEVIGVMCDSGFRLASVDYNGNAQSLDLANLHRVPETTMLHLKR